MVFHEMDLDGDGKITKDEMMKYGSLNEQEVNAVFELGDVDRDGTIDIKEFTGVMTSCSPVPYVVSDPCSFYNVQTLTLCLSGVWSNRADWRQTGIYCRQQPKVYCLVS